MSRCFLIFFLLGFYSQISAQIYDYKEGDLWFQDLDCGPFCDAIEKVTEGVNQAKFSHMGLLVKDSTGNWALLEAVSAGVLLTSIDSFVQRAADSLGNPKIVVGRISDEKVDIHKAVSRAKSYLGRPYDFVFDLENEGMYCSELMYFSFKDEYEQSIFDIFPMTFKDPDTDEMFPAWIDYYSERNEVIPEGKPGLNPGGISLSPFVEIIFVMGKPQGWKE